VNDLIASFTHAISIPVILERPACRQGRSDRIPSWDPIEVVASPGWHEKKEPKCEARIILRIPTLDLGS